MSHKTKEKVAFSSPLLMAISLIAGSVGTGNIWRFPRVMATNGGAAFIIAYIIIMIVCVIPLMMGEHIIGRSTRKSLPGAFRDYMSSKKATWFGSFLSWVIVITIAYYTVVVAWIIRYLFMSFSGACFIEDRQALFDSVSQHNVLTVLIYIAVQAFCCWGAYKGIKAIENSSKILLPILFACVVVLALRTVTLNGAHAGLNFMFDLNPENLLNVKLWLEALTQCLWSAGPGWGICIAYGVYANKKDDVILPTTVQGLGDMSVALLAAVAIIPGLFAVLGRDGALAACSSGNNGLAFVALTGVFGTMGIAGRFFAILFWLALICASITSIIAMYSIVIQPLEDMSIPKGRSSLIIGIVTISIGIPSAWSMNIFNNQDFIVGQAMVLAATFSSIALIKFGLEKTRTRFLNHPGSSLSMGRWWNISAGYIFLIGALVMFFWWCALYIGWEPEWWKPFGVYSLGGMLWQLGIVAIVLGLLNKRIADAMGKKYFNGETFPDSVELGQR